MATYWENSCSFGLRYVSWYKYLIVSLFFSHLGFWSGNLFLIAPFPYLCLLVPYFTVQNDTHFNDLTATVTLVTISRHDRSKSNYAKCFLNFYFSQSAKSAYM